ncbi:hypothetical protein CYLTODRAFT_418765 [Cylindrobasidium torrendii FP15055 ss-10]|uniref:RNA ligase/cyclic nucleotide phosphodiesterase n=1 Tax=Cylindrobasidium torrendii FP15055 ss-10 TaxID=1314674 RepID=A0A0D7BMY6_9AGAR|nr:hypothetical protein CYLTODRAFT_418765 [Cylindrobasidium torrendii FP15055 ss-10]
MATPANPFATLISEASDDPSQIQKAYEMHRTSRLSQQCTLFRSPTFEGLVIDTVLLRLTQDPSFVDTRNSLNFRIRPPGDIQAVVASCVTELESVLPGLWSVPQDWLHLTVLELAHSRTLPEIEALVHTLGAATIHSILAYPQAHPVRLVKPMLGFDSSAIALSFLPANDAGDAYGYHHLRRDIYDMAVSSGTQIASRYAVPSAHITIGRFIHPEDLQLPDGRIDTAKIDAFITKVDELNAWLKDQFWPRQDGSIPTGGGWNIGIDSTLQCGKGILWYGQGNAFEP